MKLTVITLKMTATLALTAGMAWPQISSAITEETGFSRYQVILDKSPFGKPPPPPPPRTEPPKPVQTGPSWVESYRMNMLMIDDDEQPRIGLMDVKKNISFTLGLNDDPIEGIRLKSIDYGQQSAQIEKSGDVKTIKMQETAAAPVAKTPAKPPTRTATSSIREKYLQRRAEMQKKNKQPAREPKYTGKELEQHLRDYQMEVLRNGLPPLPVPLTPEMDAKLVEEGVLPPLQGEQP